MASSEHATAVALPAVIDTCANGANVAPESVLSYTSRRSSCRCATTSTRAPAAAMPSRGCVKARPICVQLEKSLAAVGLATRCTLSALPAGVMRARSSAPSAGTAATHGPSGSLPLYQRCQRSRTTPTSRSYSRTRR